MKNIIIKKSSYFSLNSKIYLHVGPRKELIRGFGLYTLPINEGETASASQLWTGSNKIGYNEIIESNSFVIKPRLNRLLALIVGIVFLLCSILFILTQYRWSYIPLLPFVLYIGTYLTILKSRYLIIEKYQGNPK